MISKTYKELVDLDQLVGGWYEKTPTLRDSKFGYGYKRFSEKSLSKIFNEHTEAVSIINIDNALEDATTKALLSDTIGNFKYSKEGAKKRLQDLRNLKLVWDVKEFEIEPYFIKPEYFPEDIFDEQKEICKGIILE